MERRERRAEIRRLVKELNRIKGDSVYMNCLKDEEFAKVVERDMHLLKDGIHPDPNIQFKYGKSINLLSTIVQLEKRLQYLQVGFRGLVDKKGVPDVDKSE